MKEVPFVVLTILGCIVGLVAVVNLLYNVAGLPGVQDAAGGPKWKTLRAVVIFLLLALGSTYFSYGMIRSARLL